MFYSCTIDEIPAFIHYTRDLKFDDRPDYGFLKRLFKTIFDREKLEFDNDFDWFKNPKTEKTEDNKLNINEAIEKKEALIAGNIPTTKNSNQKMNSFKGKVL